MPASDSLHQAFSVAEVIRTTRRPAQRDGGSDWAGRGIWVASPVVEAPDHHHTGSVAATTLRLTGAFLLDADLTAAVALRAVAGLADEASAVILDRTHQPVRYTVVSAGLVARAAGRADLDATLRHVLRLDAFSSAAVVDLTNASDIAAESRMSTGTVVVRGPEVIGVVIANGKDRGPGGEVHTPPLATPPERPDAFNRWEPKDDDDAGGTTGGHDDDHGDTDVRSTGGRDLDYGEDVAFRGQPDPVSSQSGDRKAGRFRAFPRITAPATVAAGTPFTLEVGFTTERPVRPEGATPVVLARVAGTVEFEVQVAGFGFDFPQGIKFPLVVDREAPTGTIKVPVQAQPVPTRTTRSVEVTFAYGGAIVGEGWCDLDVIPEGGQQLDDPKTPELTARSGGTGVLDGASASTPDLTVTIRTTPGRPEVEWIFTTPHSVSRPSERVTTEFHDGTAVAFANALMAQLPADRDKPLLLSDVTGLGLQVAATYPRQFWLLLDAVWAPSLRAPSPPCS